MTVQLGGTGLFQHVRTRDTHLQPLMHTTGEIKTVISSTDLGESAWDLLTSEDLHSKSVSFRVALHSRPPTLPKLPRNASPLAQPQALIIISQVSLQDAQDRAQLREKLLLCANVHVEALTSLAHGCRGDRSSISRKQYREQQ